MATPSSRYVSEVAKQLPPSGIRKFFDIVYSLPDCISLGVGEPDFATPWIISDSGINSIKDGYTHYTPNRGLQELRNLISDQLYSHHKLLYNPDTEIIVTVGVSQALDLALRTICNPGDEIIFFEPCYVSYPANISLVYGKPVAIPTLSSDKFQIDIEKLSNAITSKTKAILLNYPSNPTGINIDYTILQQIASIAVENDLIVISDEIYSSITYENVHTSIVEFPGMKERTIYLNGFSKSHAMTGWRLGYTAAPEPILESMLKIHQYTTLCAPTMAQYAAIVAIQSGEFDLKKMSKEYTKRRNFISKRFNEIGLDCLKPEGAFYVFPSISSTGLSSEEFALKLLESKKVAVVPGTAFGKSGENHIRCSFATTLDKISEALQRIEEFITEIKN